MYKEACEWHKIGVKRVAYGSDVSDAEWEYCVPYLSLMEESAPQRKYPLRELFNAVRWLVRTGSPWRLLPHDLPPWTAVYQQTRRWVKAGCFEAMAQDLRQLARVLAGRQAQPSAVIIDSRTIQSTPESGGRGGYDGHKRRKGSKVHAVVDTLGHLLAVRITAANASEREQVAALAHRVQTVCGQQVELLFADQGYTGRQAADQAAAHGLRLQVVSLPEAKRGFVLLPKRWIIERSFGWSARFRRLARDYERLAPTLAGLHWLAFACLLLNSLSKSA